MLHFQLRLRSLSDYNVGYYKGELRFCDEIEVNQRGKERNSNHVLSVYKLFNVVGEQEYYIKRVQIFHQANPVHW